MLEADFLEHYHVDLEDIFHQKSWRWFASLVDGLLSCDSRLYRTFRDPDPEPVEVTPDE